MQFTIEKQQTLLALGYRLYASHEILANQREMENIYTRNGCTHTCTYGRSIDELLSERRILARALENNFELLQAAINTDTTYNDSRSIEKTDPLKELERWSHVYELMDEDFICHLLKLAVKILKKDQIYLGLNITAFLNTGKFAEEIFIPEMPLTCLEDYRKGECVFCFVDDIEIFFIHKKQKFVKGCVNCFLTTEKSNPELLKNYESIEFVKSIFDLQDGYIQWGNDKEKQKLSATDEQNSTVLNVESVYKVKKIIDSNSENQSSVVNNGLQMEQISTMIKHSGLATPHLSIQNHGSAY